MIDKQAYTKYLDQLFDSELDAEAETVARQSFTTSDMMMIQLLINEYKRRGRLGDFMAIYNVIESSELD